MVAQIIHTGTEKIIGMPAPADANDPDAVIIRTEEVRAVSKRRSRLDSSIKVGFATLYDQCSEQIKTKLESSVSWESTQSGQLLHKLVANIERICVGFDNHKQEVYRLIQTRKSLMLYTQAESESTDEYIQNFKSHLLFFPYILGTTLSHEG